MKILAGALMLLPVLAFAQPNVSGVNSGNAIANNSSVRISGSAFGTKPNPAPLKWDNFEAGAALPTETRLDTVQPEWVQFYHNSLGGALYTSRQAHSGARSVYNAVDRPGAMYVADPNGGPGPSIGQWETNLFRTPPSNTLFISYWFRVDTGGYGAQKMTRINSSEAAGGGGDYNGYGSYAFGGNAPCEEPQMDVSTDNGSTLNLGNVYLTTPGCGTWVHVQMGRTLNTIGVSNGWLMSSLVGYETLNFENMQNIFVAGTHDGKSLQLDTVLLGLMCANFSQGDHTAMYIDDMYIDNTRARVELGNNAVYGSCSHREMQIPSSWSASAIDVTVNTGTFAAGSAWMFVIDANGRVSPGYPVTVAAGPPVPVPGAPGKPILNGN